MKKTLTAIYITVFFTCLMAQGQSGIRPRGDVNCDWEMNLADLNTLVDHVLKGGQYHSFYTYAHDLNSDKEINLADINMLIDGILSDEPLPPMPTFSGTLPVLYINTEGHRDIVSKEEYIHAQWWLDNMGIEGYQSIGSPQSPQGMQIKGRGNYTWSVSKKSFRIKLDDKRPMLGMTSNRHYCLLAHADDHYAKLKNALGFELSRRIGLSYTPADKPVEVVLNGQYIGLYFMTEKIRVDEQRVNIESQGDGETDPTDITGGWLLEIDNNMEENTLVFQETDSGHWYDRLWITPHYPEALSDEQRQYLHALIDSTNAAIYNPDKTSTDWERYIDIDSLVSFYIIGEIMDDIEYFDGSCFMHKHKGDSTKLIFGPVWDFGNSYHRRIYYPELANYNLFLYQQPCYFYNNWIEEIAKFPHFQQVVRKRWQEFYGSSFNGLSINTFVNNHLMLIRKAWYCNAARWSGNNIDQEAYIYKKNLQSKINWLQSQWGDPEEG